MSTTADITIDDTRAKRNVIVLVMAQAFLGAQMPMLFVVGGLAGLTLAPTPLLATLPISMIILGSMTTAPWISPLMQKMGRQIGFVIGALGGATGGLICALALYHGNFGLFLLGSYFSGIYMSAQGFYRFAAADSASEDYRPKAISYVMAGGLIAALLGPQLVKVTNDAFIYPFLGTYLAAVVLNVVGMSLFWFLDMPKPAPRAADAPFGRTKMEMLKDPAIMVAIICGMVTYALMNLIMTSTPLAVVGCGFTTGQAADIVSAHVIAMFAPSFFTGHLITRFGTTKIVSIGLVCLALAGVVAILGVDLFNFYGALILLGIGWNFGFIGATAMLTANHAPHERGRAQGLNDLIVFSMVFFASLSSGGLVNSGEEIAQGWTAVNIAMVPFLTLAGGALIWLRLRPQALA